jgi:phosphoribosylaminoimidazole carboxylase PurE protein
VRPPRASGPTEDPGLPVGEAVVVEADPPSPEEEIEEAFEGLDVDTPIVGIVMAARRDMRIMRDAQTELDERGIRYEVRVASIHEDPDVVADYARNAKFRGLRVIIAAAGLGAALPGVVAAHTELPVIGVPLAHPDGVGGGLDALLGVAQMPPGVPVACVGVNGARNAAVLAVRILDA